MGISVNSQSKLYCKFKNYYIEFFLIDKLERLIQTKLFPLPTFPVPEFVENRKSPREKHGVNPRGFLITIIHIWQVFLLPVLYRACSKMKSAQWGIHFKKLKIYF